MAEEDVDMYAMMGIPMAFGKQAKKKVDVTARFDKTKRMDAPAAAATSALVKDGDDDGVLASGAQRKKDGEQAQDGEDEEEDEGDDDDGDVDAEDGLADEHSFPISHEIKLKDHTKVRYIHLSISHILYCHLGRVCISARLVGRANTLRFA